MISQSHVPEEFMCPITAEVMEDPVILADGRSYERCAIAKWLEQGSNRSPMTGEELPHASMVPNINLRALIEDWKDEETVVAAVREEETAVRELSRADLASLRSQLQGAFQQTEGVTLVVERVLEIYNDVAVSRFTRKRHELEALRGECPVVMRYHGTTHAAAAAIAREGFRLPEPDEDGDFMGQGLRVFYTEAQRQAAEEHVGDPLMFGQAVYVSTDLEKATRFAEGAVVLCQCAVGNALAAHSAAHGLTYTKLQTDGFDAVRALPGCQESGGCMFEELALYSPDQLLPTHIVHFRLAKSGEGMLVAQQLSVESRVEAQDRSVDELLASLTGDNSAWGRDLDEPRIRACKFLGDAARDDQRKASATFLCNRRLVSQLATCARSPNEALQFEALRAWWNFSFNDRDNQERAMQHLGASLLASLLASPNRSLRLRATGLIWNLTQHSAGNRLVFAEAGTVEKLTLALLEGNRAMSSTSPPWGLLQLASGALANLAMSCSDRLRSCRGLVEVGQSLMDEMVMPPAVLQQATRLICNIISGGDVDPEWQANSYSYRTSAPKDMTEAVSCA